MDRKLEAKARQFYTDKFLAFCGTEVEEDCSLITSNTFNFPIVFDGEEAWVEVTVKLSRDDEGYEKREQYNEHLVKKENERIEKEIKKAKKKEEDARKREEKKRQKETKE